MAKTKKEETKQEKIERLAREHLNAAYRLREAGRDNAAQKHAIYSGFWDRMAKRLRGEDPDK